VKEVREAIGLSQAELARRAGIRPATLNAIERGQTKGIDFDVLERLAKALSIDPALLIETKR
jgi:transcriptional regulator with XRE-family HTH domain